MDQNEMTMDEICSRGCEALRRELGVVGFIRFIQQLRPGSGDYTAERREWVDKLTSAELDRMIVEMRQRRSAGAGVNS